MGHSRPAVPRSECERRSICLIFSHSATTSSRMAPSDSARPRRRNRSSRTPSWPARVDAREDRRPFRDDRRHGRGLEPCASPCARGSARERASRSARLLVAHLDPGVAARARSARCDRSIPSFSSSMPRASVGRDRALVVRAAVTGRADRRDRSIPASPPTASSTAWLL